MPPRESAALIEVTRAAAEQALQPAAERARRLRGTLERTSTHTEPNRDGPGLGF